MHCGVVDANCHIRQPIVKLYLVETNSSARVFSVETRYIKCEKFLRGTYRSIPGFSAVLFAVEDSVKAMKGAPCFLDNCLSEHRQSVSKFLSVPPTSFTNDGVHRFSCIKSYLVVFRNGERPYCLINLCPEIRTTAEHRGKDRLVFSLVEFTPFFDCQSLCQKHL